jgi:L-2-hydroxyglutarate oxidase LhgO
MERVECIVVGAGVVGLAIARALAETGREVLVLERSEGIGTGVSSRSSEVVHAGLYYPPGSLKARACIEGKTKIYAYCARMGVPVRRIGKLVVATSETQVEALRKIEANAQACGMTDLRWVDHAEAKRLEPNVICHAGLFSETSGIIDSHALMVAFQGELESRGGVIAFHAAVENIRPDEAGFVVSVGGADRMELGCSILVNAAGLDAVRLAHAIAGYPAARIPRAFLAKGNYFSLTGVRNPFRHLVYPIPEPGGLGIHATIDMGGQVRFGPDVQWIGEPDYVADPARAPAFEAAIRAYWPGLPDGALNASYAGIRPKIAGPGEPNADFLVEGPGEHGIPGLVSLMGIESPGLTSSMSLADLVLEKLGL